MCGGDQPSSSDYLTPDCLKPANIASALPGDLLVEEFPVSLDGYTYPHGRIAYIKGRPPAPVILVHHNYAGLKQFDVDQACFLAKVGYVGLCVDLYQETEWYAYTDRWRNKGKLIDFEEFCDVVKTENILEEHMSSGRPPLAEQSDQELQAVWTYLGKDEAGRVDWYGLRHFIGSFTQMQGLFQSPGRWRRLMGAFLDAAFEHPAVKSGLAGAIGYCLGGASCLEQLRAGHQIQAICSFHGLLHSRPMHPEEPFNSLRKISKEEYESQYGIPNEYTKGCRVLIENGARDQEVPPSAIDEWVKEMDEHDVDWRFENHASGPHGFALAKGCPGGNDYNDRIDRRSSIAMLSLFAETWPAFEQYPVECNACGTKLSQLITPGGVKRFPVSSTGRSLSGSALTAGILAAAALAMAAGVYLAPGNK